MIQPLIIDPACLLLLSMAKAIIFLVLF